MISRRVVATLTVTAILLLSGASAAYSNGPAKCNDCAQGMIPPPDNPDGDNVLGHWCKNISEPLESVSDCTHGAEPGGCSWHTPCDPGVLAFEEATGMLYPLGCDGELSGGVRVVLEEGQALIAGGVAFELVGGGAIPIRADDEQRVLAEAE